jgi:hypothetical protein
MLKQSIVNTVDIFALPYPGTWMNRIVVMHKEIGIRPDHIDTWLDTIILTAEKFDPEYTAEIEACWIACLTPGMLYMKRRLSQSKKDITPVY